MPSWRAFSWSTSMRIRLVISFQSKLTTRVLAFARNVAATVSEMARTPAHIRPAHAVLQRPIHRRPERQRLDARHQRAEVLLEHLLQPRAHRVAHLVTLRDHHRLREVGVLELLVER